MSGKIVLPAFSDKVFAWLGHQTVIERAIEKLEDCRGLDELVIASADPDSVREELGSGETDLFGTLKFLKTPKRFRDSMNLLVWLAANEKEPTNLVFVNPLYPFLDRGRVEAALYCLRRTKKQVFATVRQSQVLSPGECFGTRRTLIDACMGVKTDTVVDEKVSVEALFRKAELKVIDSLESIDMKSKEGQAVAQAVVNHGGI